MGVERRALLSVTNKDGVAEFARALVQRGFEVISTGGTAKAIAAAGVRVVDVADVTGFPEILDGRVKTLHPKIHGGVLARPDYPPHAQQLADHGIAPIEIVAVNLYAFEQTVAREGITIEDAVEAIDIGGPTLLRAAAKNHADVLPIVDPADYDRVIGWLDGDGPSPAERRGLARKVFEHTHAYDGAIATYLAGDVAGLGGTADAATEGGLPPKLTLTYDKIQDLRYGENPHQRAAFYREPSPPDGALANARQLGGKPLSYNNLLDADSAWNLAVDLGERAAVFVKHNNPCGAALHAELVEATRMARAVDALSAFGAVVALTRVVDKQTAALLVETFLEVIVAPGFSEEAREVLGRKKNLRLLEMGPVIAPTRPVFDARRVGGGVVLQERDARPDPAAEVRDAKVVTKRAPTESERAALAFTWLVAKHVRSNAIVFGHADRIVAVGAGQMSRVDAVKLCQLKGGDAVKGAVVASDAFFPFRDGVDILAACGATAVIQPGGSIRDEEVIRAADEHGLAMLTTGVRHFRH